MITSGFSVFFFSWQPFIVAANGNGCFYFDEMDFVNQITYLKLNYESFNKERWNKISNHDYKKMLEDIKLAG